MFLKNPQLLFPPLYNPLGAFTYFLDICSGNPVYLPDELLCISFSFNKGGEGFSKAVRPLGPPQASEDSH